MKNNQLKTINEIIDQLAAATAAPVEINLLDKIYNSMRAGNNLTYILSTLDTNNPAVTQLAAGFDRAQEAFTDVNELMDDYVEAQAAGKSAARDGSPLVKKILASGRATVRELRSLKSLAQQIKSAYSPEKSL